MSLLKRLSLFLLLFVPLLGMTDVTITQKEVPQTTSSRMNNKPITINADKQKIDISKNTITFSGHVIIEQDGLTIKADNVFITNINDRTKQIITAYGKPVYFTQVMLDESKNITGHSDKAVYNVKTNFITLDGNAEVFQQGHQISSTTIVYDVVKQKIEAQPLKNERVKTIIVPSQVKG